jgi:hypothetical protein
MEQILKFSSESMSPKRAMPLELLMANGAVRFATWGRLMLPRRACDTS